MRAVWVGFLSLLTSSRDRSLAALSAWTPKVRSETWSLLRITISWWWLRVSWSEPIAWISSAKLPTSILTISLAWGFFRASLNFGLKSSSPLSADTTRMQSPFLERCLSFVNSTVERWVAWTFSWPNPTMTSLTSMLLSPAVIRRFR